MTSGWSIDRYLTTADGSVHYHDNEHQGPVVVLCHGNSGAADVFSRLAALLADRFRVVAFDFIGCGGSTATTRPEVAYSLAGCRRTLLAMVSSLQLEAYAMVGHSIGGHVILESLSDLEGADGVVCLAAPPVRTPDSPAFRPHPKWGLLFKDVLDHDEATELAALIADPRQVGPDASATVVESVLMASSGFRSGIASSLAAGELTDEVAQIARVDTPVWFVQGEDDPFVDHVYLHSPEMHPRPDIAVDCVESCGHSPHLSVPELVYERVVGILEGRVASSLERT